MSRSWRRRATWSGVLAAAYAQHKREMAWMAFISIFAMIIWLYQVRLLLALFLGFASYASFDDFVRVLFTTTDGISFLIIGHIVGAALGDRRCSRSPSSPSRCSWTGTWTW